MLRNPAEVLERVAAGEKIEVVEDGVLVALLSPPDITEVMTAGMIKAGILESDWREQQEQTLQHLRTRRRLRAPEGLNGSETIVEMRDEERF